MDNKEMIERLLTARAVCYTELLNHEGDALEQAIDQLQAFNPIYHLALHNGAAWLQRHLNACGVRMKYQECVDIIEALPQPPGE